MLSKIKWDEFFAAVVINAVLTAVLYQLTKLLPFDQFAFAVLAGSMFSFIGSCPGYVHLALSDADGRRVAMALAGTVSMIALIIVLTINKSCIPGWFGFTALAI